MAAKKNVPASDNLPLPSAMKPLPREITEEMQKSYLDYAMSVIVSRALPDVRDGLKPVHRRILYAMNEAGLGAGAKYRKCANVVGDVLGRYHPHGDLSVYEAMVRMAQDFSMRYMLIDGQGNFGSIDGDGAAAYRYTECRMTKMAERILEDIEKETVDMRDNYDGSRKEPVVLPSRVPALLLNGAVGIAVGMATNIPPHNLSELVDALVHLTDNPEATVDDLMQFVKGPDFPTAGMVYDSAALKAAYETGRGSVAMRGRAEIVELRGSKQAIIITEIPYQVNKASLIESIADLVRDKKITGISDLRDESNREGIRIVIELKKDAYPNKLLNQLYQQTTLQTSFGFNMIALVDGVQPQVLGLKEILNQFLMHRETVVTKRTQYDLRKAEERLHVLEGLQTALDHIEEVIETIKKADDKDDAKAKLIKKFKLSDIQAEAILEMKLRTLAGLERKKIEDEIAEKKKLIAELQAILKDRKKLLKIIKDELAEIKAAYGDERRTEIVPNAIGKFSITDTIPNEEMVVMVTKENYVKRISPSTYRAQHRGGKGIIGTGTKDEDEIKQIVSSMTHNQLLFFTSLGRVFTARVYDIPLASRLAKGQSIANLLNLKEDEKVVTVLDPSTSVGKFLFITTRQGVVKKTALEEFKNIRSNGIIAVKLRDGDELLQTAITNGNDEIILVSEQGMSVRFAEKDVRPMGRSASGVRGMRLKGNDILVKADVVPTEVKGQLVYLLTEKGLGKKTPIEEYRLQSRGGSGVKVAQLTPKTGKIVSVAIYGKDVEGDLLVIARSGQIIRVPLQSIPLRGRVTQGVFVMRLSDGDTVANMSLVQSGAGEKEEIDAPQLVEA